MIRLLPAAALLLSSASLNAAEIAASSRADAVTVFPSGAEVTRVAKVRIDKGEHTLVLTGLPANAVHSSIRVEGKSAGKLDIASVDTRRVTLQRADAGATNEARRKLEEEAEKLEDQKRLIEGQLQAADAQRALVNNLAQLPTRPAPPAGQAAHAEDWAGVLGTIAAGMGDAQRITVETQVKIRDLDRRLEDVRAKLAALAPISEQVTEVKVHVAAAAPLEADLTLRYQVPNASWTPLYDARLATGSKAAAPRLELTRRASIQQATGESWDEVAIQLSTARPSASAAAPDLRPVTVDFEPERKPQPVASPAPAIGRSRDMMAAGAPPPAEAEMVEDGAVATRRMKLASAAEVKADIVQAPFQALFAVPGRLTVPATNEAKRVKLADDAIEPQLLARTVPKHDAKAYLYAKLSLPKGSPLLPGQVSLFRDGTFVGMGRLPLLSPGEDHELGFGADDRIRVKHASADEKRGETGLISTSKTDTRNFKITVKNLHERQMPVTVLDQMPASNNQEIKVDLTSRPQPTKQNVEDRRGVLAWELKVEADQEVTIEHGYRVTWPAAKSIQYGR